MAIMLITFDEPLGIPEDQWEAYSRKRPDWVKTTLSQPGVVEWCAYFNPLRGTPTAMVICEFETYAAAQTYVQSEVSARMLEEMRGAGITSIQFQVWDNSPVFTQPLKPAGK
jgi:hypothetical protein